MLEVGEFYDFRATLLRCSVLAWSLVRKFQLVNIHFRHAGIPAEIAG